MPRSRSGVSKRLRTLVQRVKRCGARVADLVEYLDPGPVVPVPLTVGQLLSSIVGELATAGVPIEIERAPAEWAGLYFVRFDLTRLPRILEAMRIHVSPAKALRLQLGTTSVGKRPALLVVLRPRLPHDEAAPPRSRSFEWAIAERLVARHGGDIEALDVRGERVARLALPFAITRG